MTLARKIAVLSYHGWEIDPELLVSDVRSLRDQGWRAITLAELKSTLTRSVPSSGKFFHVTSDDGTEADAAFVRALRSVDCPATMFICLGRMSDAAKNVYAGLRGAEDIAIGDHTYGHERSFHYRRVVGFSCPAEPLVSSPEQLGISEGSPVCIYGPDLKRPAFHPSPEAFEVCRSAAQKTQHIPGEKDWANDIERALVASSLGFYRFGKLCIRGEYEEHQAWQQRIRHSLREGHARLREFLGTEPTAFACPWWETSPTAEAAIRELGYSMTFSGLGLMSGSSPFQIPRLPISNDTQRPFSIDALAHQQRQPNFIDNVKRVARRLLYA